MTDAQTGTRTDTGIPRPAGRRPLLLTEALPPCGPAPA